MVRRSKGGKLCLSASRKKKTANNLKTWRIIKNSTHVQNSEDVANLASNSNSNSGTSSFDGDDCSKAISISGYRLIQFDYFFKQMQGISKHNPFNCGLSDMFIVSEKQKGLKFSIKLSCKFCNLTKVIWNEHTEEGKLDINTSAVGAANVAGVGFSVLEEIITGMDMPCMSSSTFLRHQNLLSKLWSKELNDEIEQGAIIAKEAALERGDIDKDNVPLLTVVADGTWGKRSYGRHFNSLSGAAAIIDYHTRKV